MKITKVQAVKGNITYKPKSKYGLGHMIKITAEVYNSDGSIKDYNAEFLGYITSIQTIRDNKHNISYVYTVQCPKLHNYLSFPEEQILPEEE